MAPAVAALFAIGRVSHRCRIGRTLTVAAESAIFGAVAADFAVVARSMPMFPLVPSVRPIAVGREPMADFSFVFLITTASSCLKLLKPFPHVRVVAAGD